ncbi:primosomal protein N' [Kandleria sp.]|uniref:replication restart helicase PriA n=1 Tax=Kandleria sp. TaxID=2774291 RepID=UPI001B40E04A|nr:primosomal protein N' [Kandleria sp.]MBP3276906.1 primosomal protein N' [Kandleria sp.]
MYIAHVLVEHSSHALDRSFTYLSKKPVKAGVRVSIFFNHQRIVGYILNVEYTSKTKEELEIEYGFRLAYINELIDEEPILNEELLSLAKSLSKATLSPLISCLQVMLPGNLKPKSVKRVAIKTLKAIRVISDEKAKTSKQNECLEMLKSKDFFLHDVPYSRALISKLEEQGLIEIYDQEILRTPEVENADSSEVLLTDSQKKVVEGILATKEESISLIHGVTGSGKTEVYIDLTRHILEQGKNVIMLVPEISLTPMMVKIFKSRFGNQVAILHSRLSAGEKYDEYRRITRKEVRIVVGARSAIFAPLEDIGLIIMDEEHDSSYKQENTPRYATLQVAKMRARTHKCRIVLGSATPLVESYARAKAGFYHLFELPERINKKPLPHVDIVNMEEETKAGNYGYMSQMMKSRLQETIDRGEQAILLLNKRGYASFIKCTDCQEVVKCPHCDVTLTYHKNEDRLKCHYCDFSMSVPRECPSCHSTHLKKIGYGTQRIEEYIQSHIVNAKVMRFDYDTTRNKNSHTKLLKAFRNKEANILVGTQMIAKGLDFENVTFVGVLSADLTLTLPDYRASERTFQLLTQVAGRSGRGEKSGSVVIQTYNPDHYAIALAAKHDYAHFYEKEMAYRKLANYPPYCHLLAIVVQSRSDAVVKRAATEIKYHLVKSLNDAQIIGPSEAGIFKMKDTYRERILVKYKDAKPVYRILESLNDFYNKKQNGKVSMVCDFHPYTLI